MNKKSLDNVKKIEEIKNYIRNERDTVLKKYYFASFLNKFVN
jgi:hypothetical protein